MINIGLWLLSPEWHVIDRPFVLHAVAWSRTTELEHASSASWPRGLAPSPRAACARSLLTLKSHSVRQILHAVFAVDMWFAAAIGEWQVHDLLITDLACFDCFFGRPSPSTSASSTISVSQQVPPFGVTWRALPPSDAWFRKALCGFVSPCLDRWRFQNLRIQ